MSNLYILSLDDRNDGDIGVLDRVYEVCFYLANFREGSREYITERISQLPSSINDWLSKTCEIIVYAAPNFLLLLSFHASQQVYDNIIDYCSIL